MPDNILAPESLTIESLIAVLDAVGIEREPGDGMQVVLSGNHQVHLLLDEQTPPRFLRLLAAFGAPDSLSREQVLGVLNDINDGRVAVRATLAEDRLLFDYYLWTETGGVTKENLVAVVRLFDTLLADAVQMVAARL